MTLSPFACATISAATVRPSTDFSSEPSPASRTSPSVTDAPASPSILSTTILSPAATRYCLPPVRTIANMALITFQMHVPARAGPAGEGATLRAATDSVTRKGAGPRTSCSVPVLAAQLIAPVGEIVEQPGDRRVVDRLVAVVGYQVLLADIGDVARLHIFGEQVIERLVLGRANTFGNRLIPFLAVREDRVDVEDDAAKIAHAVPHDNADREARMRHRRHRHGRIGGEGRDVAARHGHNLKAVLRRTTRMVGRMVGRMLGPWCAGRLSAPNLCVRGPRSFDPQRPPTSAGMPQTPSRRGARVVDWAGLENRCALAGTVS